ncbi:MAG: DMT family transporter [Acidobacteriia bacterium]|nr:DMT family transporter [Terriglobia bacterium]
MPQTETSTQAATPQARRRRGEPWAVGQILGYSSANIFDRVAVSDVNPLVPLVGPFFRGLPSLLLGVFLVWKNHTFGQMRPGSRSYIGARAIWPFVVAGVLSTAGLFVYYYAIRVGGVIITIPVLETYVIWGTLVAWFFLGERFHGLVLLGVGLIAGGLVLLSLGQLRGQPISPLWYWAIPLALFTALSYGVSGSLWRDGQLHGAHQSTAILLQFVTSVGVAFLWLVALGRAAALVHTSTRDVAALLASGVLSGIVGIYCMFTALRLMAVTRVYAFSALNPLVAALLARFFLHEYLNLPMLAGILLVCVGVALTQIFRPKDEKQAP